MRKITVRCFHQTVYQWIFTLRTLKFCSAAETDMNFGYSINAKYVTNTALWLRHRNTKWKYIFPKLRSNCCFLVRLLKIAYNYTYTYSQSKFWNLKLNFYGPVTSMLKVNKGCVVERCTGLGKHGYPRTRGYPCFHVGVVWREREWESHCWFLIKFLVRG